TDRASWDRSSSQGQTSVPDQQLHIRISGKRLLECPAGNRLCETSHVIRRLGTRRHPNNREHAIRSLTAFELGTAEDAGLATLQQLCALLVGAHVYRLSIL